MHLSTYVSRGADERNGSGGGDGTVNGSGYAGQSDRGVTPAVVVRRGRGKGDGEAAPGQDCLNYAESRTGEILRRVRF